MRILFTVLSILFASVIASGQERLISGVLKSSEGEPLPGVNIQIKGTTVGTTTDADGRYSIRVPVGATLVFSFVGMQTREVVVGNEASKSKPSSGSRSTRKNNSVPSFPRSLLNDTIRDAPGVVSLSDDSPTHNSTAPRYHHYITGFRRIGNRYQILTYADQYRSTGYALQFTTTIGADRATALPKLQSTFAQGQPEGGVYAWRGADKSEIFSWGPLVKTLEYDGQPYAFEQHGMLVQAGTGNGKSANNYNSDLFRTGFTNANELTLSLPGPHSSTVMFDAESRIRSGIIPNSSYQKFNASLSLKSLQVNQFRINGTITYNDSRGTLLAHGANIASIVGAMYRTPATFDNANGLSVRQARSSSQSYLLEDGNIRSHAPGVADNPFGLINQLPDNDRLQRLIGLVDMKYKISDQAFINVNANTDRQSSKNVFGIPSNYSGYNAGRMTEREELQWLSSVIISPTFEPSVEGDLSFGIVWQMQNVQHELKRSDGFAFATGLNMNDAGVLLKSENELSRFTHELSLQADYRFEQWLKVRLSNRSYFSNTVSTKRYTNLLPSAGISVDFAQLEYLYPFDQLKVHASYSRSLREAPLVYSGWSHLSTRINVGDYSSFYEDRELYFNAELIPESEQKFETGLSMRTGRFVFDAEYFDNHTDDFVSPVYKEGVYKLANVASIRNYGTTISLDVNGSMPDGHWTTGLRWTKSYSRVAEVYGANEIVPLAGFLSVQSVLATGKPLGAIYGTTYRRNADNKIVVGGDGFPIEDQQKKMIGNPIPDWVLGWSINGNIRNFGLSLLFDFKRGGDVWNGTQSALDYLGRSATTADQRQTSGFVFDGVDENGDPNTIPVNFSDPQQSVTSNRWVRYGWDGVGEDYIEDGSWIRLSEVNLSYTIKRYADKTVKEVKFNLIGRNLFLITPYSGVDPSSTLFGYSTGSGLDLFNAPSVRSYNLQVTIKI